MRDFQHFPARSATPIERRSIDDGFSPSPDKLDGRADMIENFLARKRQIMPARWPAACAYLLSAS